jgi:GNAT superfamily N-acetyltransferase
MGDRVTVEVRPMVESDLGSADTIFRLAFGTFLGAPKPEEFFGSADIVNTRFRASPSGALTALVDGRIVGSAFCANWGSVGVFGPLSIHPEYWDRGIGHELLAASMELFDGWTTCSVGLFTFADSAKHVGLYQRYGFWPRFLTAIMSKPVGPVLGDDTETVALSELAESRVLEFRRDVIDLCDAVHPGLNLWTEIDAVLAQGLGEVVVLTGDRRVAGVAVCHIGAGSEAGDGTCYVKFAALRPGPMASKRFGDILAACERTAKERGATTINAGVNAARVEAWKSLRAYGFKPNFQGVAMQRPDEAGYNHAGSFVIDDWR